MSHFPQTINYFAYMETAEEEVLVALLGRRPAQLPALLRDYELCTAHWQHIPRDARDALVKYWDSSFQAHAIRPAVGKSVEGSLIFVTITERDILKAWMLTGKWFERIRVDVGIGDGWTTMLRVETDTIRDSRVTSQLSPVVQKKRMIVYLNGHGRTIEVANRVRTECLKRLSRPPAMRVGLSRK